MNVFIGVLIGFLLGAILTCLISRFLNRCESFEVETEEKFKKVREARDRQAELNAAYDERIKRAEETIAALTQAIMPREKGRHEARSEEGGIM